MPKNKLFTKSQTLSKEKISSAKSKYGAVRTGNFKSKLECNVNALLEKLNIPNCYECESITLIPKFKDGDKNYRELKYIPDFILYLNGTKYYLEIKGFETPEFKLKWKLLRYFISNLDSFKEYSNKEFIVVKNLKELKTLIERLHVIS